MGAVYVRADVFRRGNDVAAGGGDRPRWFANEQAFRYTWCCAGSGTDVIGDDGNNDRDIIRRSIHRLHLSRAEAVELRQPYR